MNAFRSAEHYLKLKFALVVIPAGSKGPTGKGWQKRPITTAQAAQSHWGNRQTQNIGLLHSASHTAALDIDHEAAADALAAVGINLQTLLEAPGPKIRSLKGLKPIYQLPEGVTLSRKALAWPDPDGGTDPKTGKPKLITVFELRAGPCQDVLPPSIHPDSGKPYAWEPAIPSSREELPELPESLLALWQNWGALKPTLERACPWLPPPPSKKHSYGKSAISSFNELYSIREILERNHYTPKGRRYLAPSSSTGIPGVAFIRGDDGIERCYSHHGADPLADGHSHDAFSAYCILEHGGMVKEAVKAAAKEQGLSQSRGEERSKTLGRDPSTLYFVENGSICYHKPTREGLVLQPLCNFSAYITSELERDDGAERMLTLTIEGKLASGKPLPPLEVPTSQFAAMNWPVLGWGSRAVVYAGLSAKDHLRASIQLLSGDVLRHTVYTHIGWRRQSNGWAYLHAGGTLGADGPITEVMVEPPQGLEQYHLPEPPTSEALKAALHSSSRLLDLAQDTVTVPLYAAVWRASLGEVNFSLHVAGETGQGKSELVTRFLQHYGAEFRADNLPGSWSSTANALEGLAFAAKDALLVVDDFAPSGSSNDISRYHATAERLFRAQGNRSARGRMKADGTLRPPKPPRGLIISTGEDNPRGHSIKARGLILEVENDTVDWRLMTVAQEQGAKGDYAAAMAAYLVWLAQDYDARLCSFRKYHASFRTTLQQSNKHKRTIDEGAQLLASLQLYLDFAHEVGALTEREQTSLWQRLYAGITTALEPQAEHQADSDPVARFQELLPALFLSGRAHVVDAQTGTCPSEGWGWERHDVHSGAGLEPRAYAKGTRIGWLEGDNLYLEPDTTYAELQRLTREQGESIPVTARTLWKRLHERQVLVSREEPHYTVRRQGLAGASGRVRVLHLTAILSPNNGPSGPYAPQVVHDGAQEATSWPTQHLVTESESGPQQSTSVTQRGSLGPLGSSAADETTLEKNEGADVWKVSL